MTEFSYLYNKDIVNLILSSVGTVEHDLICLDFSGLGLNQQKLAFGVASGCVRRTETCGCVMLWHDDTLAFTRFLFAQLKDPKGLCGLKLVYTLNIMCGYNRPIPGGAINAQLVSPIQRVVSVFYTDPEKMVFNPTGNKNTLIEGDKHSGFGGKSPKCIGGDIFANLLYQFKYDEFKSVFIANFERPFLSEFVKAEPRKPTEKFRFHVTVGESNIKAIDSARMDCAINDVSCDFSGCPSPAETTKMLKELNSTAGV